MTTGILLVSHAKLAKGLLSAAEQILQIEINDIEILGINSKQDLTAVRSVLDCSLTTLSKNCTKIIALCDTYGATATRLLLEVCPDHTKFACVFGVNLPMLLDAISQRNTMELNQLAKHINATGQESIFIHK